MQQFLHLLQHSLSAHVLLQGIITFQLALWSRSRLKGLAEGCGYVERSPPQGPEAAAWGLWPPSRLRRVSPLLFSPLGAKNLPNPSRPPRPGATVPCRAQAMSKACYLGLTSLPLSPRALGFDT